MLTITQIKGYNSYRNNTYTATISNANELYPVKMLLYPGDTYTTIDGKKNRIIDNVILVYELHLYNEDMSTIYHILNCDTIQVMINSSLYDITVLSYEFELINNSILAKHLKLEVAFLNDVIMI